jgi:ribosomal protein S18 acetylase RimI-like enzyme
MAEADIAEILAVAAVVHPSYPEDPAVFADRFRLYPAGCLVLDGDRGEGDRGIAAYLISHPWLHGRPPKLNRLLGALPAEPTTYYIHDLALLPRARGAGAASAAVGMLAEHAASAGFSTLSLVAVNDSAGFWRRRGFHTVADPAIDQSLASYDQAACFMVRDIQTHSGA